MHARIATYRVIGGTVAEITQMARSGMLAVFRESSGFLNYGLVDTGDGRVVSLSLWTTAEAADAAVTEAAAFVRTNLADHIVLESNVMGDVTFFEGPSIAA
jgi:heme-degrading monooxygenase HmoA